MASHSSETPDHGGSRIIVDMPVKDATPAEIASALRGHGRKRFGNKVLMTAGATSYTAEDLAREIEQETELGSEYLAIIRRGGETLADLFRVPTEQQIADQGRVIRESMAAAGFPTQERPPQRKIWLPGDAEPGQGTKRKLLLSQ